MQNKPDHPEIIENIPLCLTQQAQLLHEYAIASVRKTNGK